MRAHRRDERVTNLARRDRPAVRVRAVQQQPIHAVRKPRGERDRSTTARRSAEQIDALQRELVQNRTQQRNLALECPLLRLPIAVRHANARTVVTHEHVPLAERLPERSKRPVAPVELEMADPPRRRNQRRALPAHRIRDAATPKPQESDPHLANHQPRRYTKLPHTGDIAKAGSFPPARPPVSPEHWRDATSPADDTDRCGRTRGTPGR